MISCFVISCLACYSRLRSFTCLQNTHHHAHEKLSVFISLSLWRGTEAHFPQEPQFLASFQTSANIWKGDWLRLWSARLEPVRPFWLETKMLHEYEQHQNNESCAAAKWEFTHVGLLRWWKRDASHTLNLWQDSLKARALAYQFFFLASQRRDDVRCGGAVCFISLRSSTPPLPPLLPLPSVK